LDCDGFGFDLGTLARRRCDDVDSSPRKSENHWSANPAAPPVTHATWRTIWRGVRWRST